MSVDIRTTKHEPDSSSESLRGTWADEVTRSERKVKKSVAAAQDDASSPLGDISYHNSSNCSTASQDRNISVEFLDEINEQKFKKLVKEEKIKTPFKRRHESEETNTNSPDCLNSDESNESHNDFEEKRRRPSSQTSSSNSSGYVETDPAVLSRRQKQIDYGKNTAAYERFVEQVPRAERTRDHPRTPNKYGKYSRRAFDGLVKIWRKQLHYYDPPTEKSAAAAAAESSDSSSDEAD